jgi:alkylation response protein AidB-like acyl-CoA dehydrogenase
VSLEYDIQLYHRRAEARSLLLGDPVNELLSVGRRLWQGETTVLPEAGTVTLDFGYGAAAEALAQETRAFFKANLTSELAAKAHFAWEGHNWEFNGKLGQAGLLLPAWPEEFGGRGVDEYSAIRSGTVWEDYGWGRVGTMTTDMVGRMLMWFGHPEVKTQVLPQIARGEVVCSLGYSEPGSGSDIFAARTRAVREGADWIINGQKMFTSGADNATYVFLLARTDPNAPKHMGITLFLVPLDLPGVEIRPIYTFQDERTNTTFYTDVRVPDRYRIGEVNGGTKVLSAALTLEQGGIYYVAVCDKMLQAALDWAHGKGLGTPGFDSVALSRLARVAVHNAVSDGLCRRSIWARVEGKDDLPYGPISKLFATESYNRDSTELLHLTAPDSIVRGLGIASQLELDHRRSTAGTIHGGASEILRSLVAEKALGLPRSR